jgi:ketosteroid isomerase-like protein
MNVRSLTVALVSLWCGLTGMAGAAPYSSDRARVEVIFAAHDRQTPAIEEYMAAVADDVILMPQGAPALEGKAAYRRNVEEFYASGTRIRHEVIAVYSYAEVVIVRGRAVGSFVADGKPQAFETKNLFVFRRSPDGGLKVWQIIFNQNPQSG